ncbi:LacI family DNA-binding transcriptional regulator [Streptomyces litchfieldiae]|uniref:Substrate-binding domain-containing protein n=1 Tax=Streptomyces litchfieldiae TaxID=3075543 RepID=A0ABU2MZ19_9ACTN|nr:substrate-binding domain-containing protein [Streptomyces sp. DSM 44938]MDT0346896.1 substrate-binding domain-containing protein [Streptomyces sp. DSM 44938]
MAEMLVAQRHQLLVSELEAAGGLKVTELATRLGVSRATVRRDLVDLENEGRVARVRGGAMLATPRAAEEPPPAGATAPAAHTLGLLVPSATYYYPRVVAGVRAVAAERGARVVIGLTDYARADDARHVEELGAAGATGLLVASAGGHHLPPEVFERLRDRGLPFVLLEREPQDPFEPCEFVNTDHRQGAFAAVRHFAGLGHRRVGLFTNGSPTAALVREGHGAAVRQLGLGTDAPVVDSGRPTLGSAEATRYYDGFIEACRAGGTRAALVHSDHDAIELMRRMRSHGLGTPEDLALIAYDDEIASLADVPLTAVAPPKNELGEQAARLLLDRLDAPDPSAVPVRQLVMQPRLVIRSSCGASRPA